MDRFTSLRAFAKVVESGSFTAAAAGLGLSGAMVGKHVRALEGSLGVRLLNRTTRRVDLTEVGRAYYERCRSILDDLAAADAQASSEARDVGGRVRVTAPVLFGRYCVAPVLLDLARRHPALELDLAFSDRLLDLREDGFDLAIRTGSLSDSQSMMARRVARQKMVICASPDYITRRGRPVSVSDLTEHEAVIYSRTRSPSPWLLPQQDGQILEVMPSHRLRLDDLDAIADAAAAGAGLAWLPSWLIRDRLFEGALVVVLGEVPSYLYDCHALWPQTSHLPRRVRLVLDELIAELPRRVEMPSGIN